MYKSFLLILLLSLSSCSNEKQSKNLNTSPKEEINTIPLQSKKEKEIVEEKDTTKRRLKILVVPCANGYDYSTKGFDLEPLLEKHLNSFQKIEILEFPYKKMSGSGYHGVFDKKHCTKILENTDADFLVLNRMKGELFPLNSRKGSWAMKLKLFLLKT